MEKETLETFVNGMITAGKALHAVHPNVIIAPINGAVPLIDILNIVDHEFDNSQVEYMPASSKIDDVKHVVKDWTYNFLMEHCPSEGQYSMVILDEVVSGNSSVRVYKAMTEGINAFTRKKADEWETSPKAIKRRIGYKSIGIKDEKCPIKSKEYKQLIGAGIAEFYPVGTIITMDNPDYTLVQFKSESKAGRLIFHPEIENIVLSPKYLALLEDIAKTVGADPSGVSHVNPSKVMNSTRYLKKEPQIGFNF